MQDIDNKIKVVVTFITLIIIGLLFIDTEYQEVYASKHGCCSITISDDNRVIYLDNQTGSTRADKFTDQEDKLETINMYMDHCLENHTK